MTEFKWEPIQLTLGRGRAQYTNGLDIKEFW